MQRQVCRIQITARQFAKAFAAATALALTACSEPRPFQEGDVVTLVMSGETGMVLGYSCGSLDGERTCAYRVRRADDSTGWYEAVELRALRTGQAVTK